MLGTGRQVAGPDRQPQDPKATRRRGRRSVGTVSAASGRLGTFRGGVVGSRDQDLRLATIRNRRWRPEPSSAEAGLLLINHSFWTAKDSMMTASRPPRGHGGMAREAVADGHRQFVPTILP
jgi:hypothetical protein